MGTTSKEASEQTESHALAAEASEDGSSRLTSWTAPAGTTLARDAVGSDLPAKSPSVAGVSPASELDIARALLTGGEQGIQVWNDRRRLTRERLDLSRIDLKGVNLSSADLCECVLRNANLSGAVLFG